jgi:hypothetical protein
VVSDSLTVPFSKHFLVFVLSLSWQLHRFSREKLEKKHVVQTVLCPALLPPNTKELHIVTILIVIASMVLSSSSSSRLFGLDCCIGVQKQHVTSGILRGEKTILSPIRGGNLKRSFYQDRLWTKTGKLVRENNTPFMQEVTHRRQDHHRPAKGQSQPHRLRHQYRAVPRLRCSSTSLIKRSIARSRHRQSISLAARCVFPCVFVRACLGK